MKVPQANLKPFVHWSDPSKGYVPSTSGFKVRPVVGVASEIPLDDFASSRRQETAFQDVVADEARTQIARNQKHHTTTTPRSKRCSKCGESKSLAEYPKHTTSSDGHAAYCRDCKNGLAKERRMRDPIARITHYTVTRIKNEWPKESIPKDIQSNLESYLGYRMYELKRKLSDEVKAMYGITLIESFKLGYHLDHIQPHKSFESDEIGDEEFQRCWAISNLRMIPAKENLQKGAKLDYYA